MKSREEVIRALRICGDDNETCHECAYQCISDGCNKLLNDAADLLEGEQDEI